MKCFVLLFALGFSSCTHTFEGSIFELTELELKKGDEICINATKKTVYLVFSSIPYDMNIYFYRILTINGSLSLDWRTKTSNLSYSMRSIFNYSSYTLEALQDGKYTIGIVVTPSCPEGTAVITSSLRNLHFSKANSPSDNDFYTLKPGSKKCILIANNFSTIITASININPQKDYLYHYIDGVHYNSYTAVSPALTFNSAKAIKPFLFQIYIDKSEYKGIRAMNFTIRRAIGEYSDVLKEIYFGDYGSGEIIPPSEPTKQVHLIWDVDLYWTCGMIATVILFVVFLILTCKHIEFTCSCKFNSSKQAEAIPPSSFVVQTRNKSSSLSTRYNPGFE